MANCIEADNEINLIDKRLKQIDQELDNLGESTAETLNKILIRMSSLENKLLKIHCPRCHPKFDEDGIL